MTTQCPVVKKVTGRSQTSFRPGLLTPGCLLATGRFPVEVGAATRTLLGALSDSDPRRQVSSCLVLVPSLPTSTFLFLRWPEILGPHKTKAILLCHQAGRPAHKNIIPPLCHRSPRSAHKTPTSPTLPAGASVCRRSRSGVHKINRRLQ